MSTQDNQVNYHTVKKEFGTLFHTFSAILEVFYVFNKFALVIDQRLSCR